MHVSFRYVETSALDSTNVEQAFRTLINDIYRNWAVRMDAMKEESSNVVQTIKPGYLSASNPHAEEGNKSCCSSFS